MRVARVFRRALALGLLLLAGAQVHADTVEHISLWTGGGIGTVLTGEAAPFSNGHKMGMLSISLPGDRYRLRLMKGSLERTQGVPEGTGDNDIDYRGFDVVITRQVTDWPFSLAVGAAQYEEAYHLGYPNEDLGGSEFVHKWGPHVSVLRSWQFARFFEAWAEADLHYAPYDSPQTILMIDIGIGVHF
jgi:hypothetical protein